MTTLRGKPSMVAVYCEEVKQREWRLRRIRQDIAKAGRITREQWVARTKLVAQVRALYDLRTGSRALARLRASERRSVVQPDAVAS